MILNYRGTPFHHIVAVGLLLTGAAASLPAQTPDIAAARRIATVTTIALTEYGAGVVDGRLVAASEVEEARLFVRDARAKAVELSPALRDVAIPLLDTLAAAIDAHRPTAELNRTVVALREALARGTGAALDPLPEQPPSLARGRAVFGEQCAVCHGKLGRGDGPKAAELNPPPANLTDLVAVAGASPLDFMRKVSVGVAGTAMPAWESKLSESDRWAVALYAATLRFPDSARAQGRAALAGCTACLDTLSDAQATVMLSDDSLRALVARLLAPHDSVTDAMVAYARVAAASEELGSDRRLQAVRVVARVKGGVAEAEQLAAAGTREAALARATDAYLEFERIETTVRARDSHLATAVEQAFADFRAALAAPDTSAMSATRAGVERALDAALQPVIGGTTALVLFSQSLIIMLREGLEAILIIGALTAVLVKAGAPERKKEIGWGVVTALVASLGTAALLAMFVERVTAHREALEGITILVAALVLFWVSYWLVSKIEIKKWQAFVGQQMRKALTGGGALALAAVAFLAVYREGFETVLFYAALFAAGDGVRAGRAAIGGGIAVGFGALVIVYYAIQRYGVRLPLKPFFAVTSTLLYVMAFSFVGQGIADLQEAGLVPATPLAWAPSLPFLGVFPTLQTLAMQALLVLAVVLALAWVFWLAPSREPQPG